MIPADPAHAEPGRFLPEPRPSFRGVETRHLILEAKRRARALLRESGRGPGPALAALLALDPALGEAIDWDRWSLSFDRRQRKAHREAT